MPCSLAQGQAFAGVFPEESVILPPPLLQLCAPDRVQTSESLFTLFPAARSIKVEIISILTADQKCDSICHPSIDHWSLGIYVEIAALIFQANRSFSPWVDGASTRRSCQMQWTDYESDSIKTHVDQCRSMATAQLLHFFLHLDCGWPGDLV